jgi:hypothetical protein
MPKVLLIVLSCAVVGLLMTAWAVVEEHRLPAATVQSMSGELVTYEASSEDLVIRTTNGDRHVTLREDTPVHEGARVLVHADLASASGCPAKIWYRDTGARWIASDVRVSCRPIVPHGDPRSF